jgi:hypothetical protein
MKMAFSQWALTGMAVVALGAAGIGAGENVDGGANLGW